MINTTAAPIYSDFAINFNPHPVTGDLIRMVNGEAVKRAIRNLIFTNKTERFFQPLVGASIQRFLFEPMTPQTTFDIQQAIEQVIYNYEPRISQLNVNIVPDFSNQSYNITISFYIINITAPITLSITLSRLR